ncbi:AEC family transporter [Candidatus Omnitrophota bacterium]
MIFFQTTLLAMAKIVALGSIGYFLAKGKILNEKTSKILAMFVIYVTLPLFIFSEIIHKFDFAEYPLWWVYPLLSIAITFFGWFLAIMHLKVVKHSVTSNERRQLISLVAFQNSGYLPLIIAAELFAPEVAGELFMYIFLFLIGFNFIIWSFGAWFLSGATLRELKIGSLFSPPVVATVISLVGVLFGLERFVSEEAVHYSHIIGKWTLPLAMIALGTNLARVTLRSVKGRLIAPVCTMKLVVMPLCALLAIVLLRPSELLAFIILIELAVPSATSLSLIMRHSNIEDRCISHGIFFTHIASIITLPIFLIIFQLLRSRGYFG